MSLPISSYYQMVVDAAHGHIFISQGSSSQDGILVTDLSGQVITTITGQSGVVGIALSPDGSTLYAALSTADAVTAISTGTLTQTASYSLPAGDSPFNVAAQSGKIWVSYSTGTLFAAAIGSFDPSAASPTLQTPAVMSGWSSAPQIAADPQDTGVLVATGSFPDGLASYDTAADPVTTLAGSPTGSSGCSDEQDLAVSPGGSEFAVACHDSGESRSGVQHGQPEPAALARLIYRPALQRRDQLRRGGRRSRRDDDLRAVAGPVYLPPGTATAVNTYSLYSLGGAGGILAPRGLAWVPDGSQVFGVLSRGSSFALAMIANPTAPPSDPTTTFLNCSPNPAAIGQATSCTAAVTDTAPGGVAPTGTVTFTSDTSGGSFSSNSCTLAPDSTIGQASCLVSYTPGQTGSGTQTITAAYGGDSGHTASSGQAVLTVTLRATTTALTCQRSLLVFQKCTATVSDTSAGSAITPTGTVSFSSSGRGVFSATHCTLSGTGTSASCTVTFQPLAGVPFNSQTITAKYGGDSTHQSSTGSTNLR